MDARHREFGQAGGFSGASRPDQKHHRTTLVVRAGTGAETGRQTDAIFDVSADVPLKRQTVRLNPDEHKRVAIPLTLAAGNGQVLTKSSGEGFVYGPYKMEQRKKLLRTLLETQKRVRSSGPDPQQTLITPEELEQKRIQRWIERKKSY